MWESNHEEPPNNLLSESHLQSSKRTTLIRSNPTRQREIMCGRILLRQFLYLTVTTWSATKLLITCRCNETQLLPAMISCAYALLFSNEGYLYGPSSFSNLRLNQPEETSKVSVPHSLVILGDGFRNSFYGAYEFPSDGQFPIPDAKFGIAKTQDKSHRSGT